MANENEIWYLTDDDQNQIGPFTSRKVQNFLDEGELDESSYIWCDGFDSWKQIKDVNTFNNEDLDLEEAEDEKTIQCPSCQLESTDLEECTHCGFDLTEADTKKNIVEQTFSPMSQIEHTRDDVRSDSKKGERAFVVGLISLLMFCGGAVLLYGYVTGSGPVKEVIKAHETTGVVWIVVSCFVFLFTGYGLWIMKKWAFYLFFIYLMIDSLYFYMIERVDTVHPMLPMGVPGRMLLAFFLIGMFLYYDRLH